MYPKFIVPAVAVLSLAVQPAVAQELTGTLKKIKDSGTITIGHRDASPPFSYYDDKQQVVGYAMDLCYKIADAVKKELKLQKLDIKLNPVTSATRIPLMANGTIDLECGSTTNNLERQQQVGFTITHFVTANRFLSKKANNLKSVDDLKGKTITSTSGTTNIKQITELSTQKNLGLNIIPAKDHAEAFLMVETDRAAAFVMDDILLAALAANSKSPGDYVISPQALSVEPYGIMVPRGDAAYKKVVDAEMTRIYKSGEINAIYDKWFTKPIPPKGANLNLPMSDSFKKVVANPTSSGDPKDYKYPLKILSRRHPWMAARWSGKYSGGSCELSLELGNLLAALAGRHPHLFPAPDARDVVDSGHRDLRLGDCAGSRFAGRRHAHHAEQMADADRQRLCRAIPQHPPPGADVPLVLRGAGASAALGRDVAKAAPRCLFRHGRRCAWALHLGARSRAGARRRQQPRARPARRGTRARHDAAADLPLRAAADGLSHHPAAADL
jgi:glutamate/aspartate transport system substrate-binding protein